MQSRLLFRPLDQHTIEVIDPEALRSDVVGRIVWDPEEGDLTFDAIDGDYLYHKEDLIRIANYMSKLDLAFMTKVSQ